MTNVKQSLKKVMKTIENRLKAFFTLQESSRRDYRRLGNRYVAKRVYVLVILMILVIPLAIYFYILPFAEGRLWEAKLHTTSYKLSDFSGRARIVDKEDTMIFKGVLDNGQINGYGEVYAGGGLVYAGNFQNGLYDGDGVEYDATSRTIRYEGAFKNNLYDGEGIYYFEDGNHYVGTFSMGLMEGDGKLYTPDYLLYEGTFKDGRYDGEGILYFDDGTIAYKGSFKNGQFEGTGALTYNYINRLRYEGAFQMGVFSGEGILYDEHSKPVYTGAFKDGQFDYLRYKGEDINVLRDAFGTEDDAYLFETSFVTVYDSIHMMVACDYATLDSPVIATKKIMITGDGDGCDNLFVGNMIEGHRVVLKEAESEYFNTEDMIFLLGRLSVDRDSLDAYDVYTDVNTLVVLADQHGVIVAIII
ncbi:MAG: hypothetical protein JXO44_05920 [Clostridia bacterium]|nr:hypothetical protein [Clostridia bacterium]